MSDIAFHELPDRRRIAFRQAKGTSPTLVFLPGYMSDMSGSKATALFDAAREQGRACLLFDYSGCGHSEGEFAEGSLSRWRDEALHLIEAQTEGQVLLTGSSMGGWLMLLIAEQLGSRVAGVIGIAAAPDFTRWGYSDEHRALLEAGEIIHEPNPYGPEPTPTHPGFFADAERNLRLEGGIAIACPVRLIHGQRDADVPWQVSLRLAGALRSDKVQVVLVKDGDHRMSQPDHIALLKAVVAEFY